MARQSPYQIELSTDARKMLEADRRTDIRHRIVMSCEQRSCSTPPPGLSNEAIAARIDLPRQIVSKWRKRFYEEGLPGLQERPRHGRPPVFSPRRRRRGQGAGL